MPICHPETTFHSIVNSKTSSLSIETPVFSSNNPTHAGENPTLLPQQPLQPPELSLIISPMTTSHPQLPPPTPHHQFPPHIQLQSFLHRAPSQPQRQPSTTLLTYRRCSHPSASPLASLSHSQGTAFPSAAYRLTLRRKFSFSSPTSSETSTVNSVFPPPQPLHSPLPASVLFSAPLPFTLRGKPQPSLTHSLLHSQPRLSPFQSPHTLPPTPLPLISISSPKDTGGNWNTVHQMKSIILRAYSTHLE